MSSAQFHCTQYSGAGATNIYQLRPMDGGLALQPPPLPEKSNSGSCVSDHLTKSARRTPPNLRLHGLMMVNLVLFYITNLDLQNANYGSTGLF